MNVYNSHVIIIIIFKYNSIFIDIILIYSDKMRVIKNKFEWTFFIKITILYITLDKIGIVKIPEKSWIFFNEIKYQIYIHAWIFFTRKLNTRRFRFNILLRFTHQNAYFKNLSNFLVCIHHKNILICSIADWFFRLDFSYFPRLLYLLNV